MLTLKLLFLFEQMKSSEKIFPICPLNEEQSSWGHPKKNVQLYLCQGLGGESLWLQLSHLSTSTSSCQSQVLLEQLWKIKGKANPL